MIGILPAVLAHHGLLGAQNVQTLSGAQRLQPLAQQHLQRPEWRPMQLPYDIETALRRHLRERADQPKISVWVNNEDRMVLLISDADGTQTEFVAVGDCMIPYPVKPPAQRVAAAGFDAHKGMGAPE